MPASDRKRRTSLFVLALVALVAAPLGVVASDAFTDVPDSNVFHGDIAWLADAQVTLGCNPPANTNFCPSDNVTREQMAAFMHRLADNQVVDAGTVDGHEADGLTRVAFGVYEAEPTVTGTYLTAVIEAPAAGYLLIAANMSVFPAEPAAVSFNCKATVDGGTPIEAGRGIGQYAVPDTRTCTVNSHAVVDAGSHEVAILVGGFNTSFQAGSLTVQFLAFGPEGEPPIGG